MSESQKTHRIIKFLVISSLILVMLSGLLSPIAGTLLSLPVEGYSWYLDFLFGYTDGLGRGMHNLAVGLFFPICLWLLAKNKKPKSTWFFAVWSSLIFCLQILVMLIHFIWYFAFDDEYLIEEIAYLFPGGLWERYIIDFFDYSQDSFDVFGNLLYILSEGGMLLVPLLCCIGFFALGINNKKQSKQAEVV